LLQRGGAAAEIRRRVPGRPGCAIVVLDVCRYDPATQILAENHVRIAADSLVMSPIRLRLAHPPELGPLGARSRDR
jgi:hypothetical protein